MPVISASGKILQIVSAAGDESGDEGLATQTLSEFSLAATITPISASSVIRIRWYGNFSVYLGSGSDISRRGFLAVQRASTAGEGSAANGTTIEGEKQVGHRLGGAEAGNQTSWLGGGHYAAQEGSPGAGAAVVYTVCGRANVANSTIQYDNDGSNKSRIVIEEVLEA